MLNLDPAKLLVIGVIALVVIGPERLPKFARQMGTVWRTLTTYREQAEAEIRKAMPDLDLPHIPRSPSAAVSGYLTDLMNPATRTSADLRSSESDEDTGRVVTSLQREWTTTSGETAARIAPRTSELVHDDAEMN